MLNRLFPVDGQSRRLFGDAGYERTRRVMKGIDEINARLGPDTVRLGVARPDAPWKTKFLQRSPHYTTRLNVIRSTR